MNTPTATRRRPPACPICRRFSTDSVAARVHRDTAHGRARTYWWAVRQPHFYQWWLHRITRRIRRSSRR